MEAITHFLKALESKPNFSAAHLNLGNAYARRDNFNIAMQHYYQAIRFNPRFIEAYTQLGIALIQVGRRDDAAACFRTALKLTPGDKKVIQYLKQILSTKSSRNENLSMDEQFRSDQIILLLLKQKGEKKKAKVIFKEMKSKYISTKFKNKIKDLKKILKL